VNPGANLSELDHPVMPGPVPGIHVFFLSSPLLQDVDGRVKPGHDGEG
jgi:hypothetical protein